MNYISTLNEYLNKSNETELILYHGSNTLFDSFLINFIGSGNGNDVDGPGIYFSNFKNNEYKEYNASHYGRYIYTVKIKTDKLLYDSSRDGLTKDILVNMIKKCDDWKIKLQEWNADLNKGLEIFLKYINCDNSESMLLHIYFEFYNNKIKEFINNAVDLGIDGIVSTYINGKDSELKHYIIYNPDIIEILEVEEVQKDGTYKRIK